MLLRIGIVLIGLGVVAGITGALVWGFDGPDRDRTIEYRVVDADGTPSEGGDQVIVVEDGRDGPPFFFPAVPLVGIGVVLIVIGLVTRGGGGWGGPHGRFERWHGEAHRETGAAPGPPAS